MKKTARLYPRIVLILFVLSFFIPNTYAAQMIRRPTRGNSAAPTVTKPAPEQVKTAHKSTPKSLLAVKKIYITPTSPRLGDKVTIHALVINNGPKDVKNVKVNFYLGRKIVAWQMYNIASRGKQDYVGYFTKTQAPKAGDYTIRVLIDPNQALERSFYKCNTASLKITVLPPIVRKTSVKTISKKRPVPKSRSRHAFIRPAGPTVGRGTPVKSTGIKTMRQSPARTIQPVVIPPGKITRVAVTLHRHTGSRAAKTRQFHNTLDIRWSRTGVLPNRVDIFLHPYRGAGRVLCLKRDAVNNGHVNLPVPGKVKTGQRYIVRVQTHDGKVHGDSKSFSPKVSVKGNGHPGAVAVYHNPPAPLLRVISPRQGETWTMKKTYKIQWLLLGPKTAIQEISLWKVSRSQKPALSIFPTYSGEPISKISSSIPWTIPSTIDGGNYYILVKTGNLTAKSAPFQIALPPYMAIKKKKPQEWNKPHPNHPQQRDPNCPRITYFHAPSVIHDKATTAGRAFGVTEPEGIHLSIYWEDPDGDLGGGRYRLTYSFSCNAAPSEKRDLGWEPFNAVDDYSGNKGMGVFYFKFGTPCASPLTFHYTFTLMDKAGHYSNTVKGTVHWVKDDDTTASIDHDTDEKGKTPPSSSPGDKSELSLHAPEEWVSGLPVFIRGKIPAGLLVKNNRYEMTLWNASSNGCGKSLKETIVVSYTNSADFNITWPVDSALTPGAYCLKVLVNKTLSATKIINITRAGLVLDHIQGSLYVGDPLKIKWQSTIKNSGKYTYNLYWHSFSDGKDYLIGNGKIGAQSFDWKVGSCLPVNSATRNGSLPPAALGSGFLHFKGRLYGCNAKTDTFDILEHPLDFRKLNIQITDPDRNTQWGGQTYWVRWKTPKNTSPCPIEVFVINAITGQTVSGPWKCWASDGKIKVHIPEYDSSHKILAIPARIKIKPKDRIDEGYTVYSEPFEIL